MSATEGLKIGKAVFNILSNNSNLLSVTGMSAAKIQPAPMKEQGNADVGVLYEFDAVNPVNRKREFRLETAPLYIVDFTCECIARDYSTSVILADAVGTALQVAASGTYNSVKVDGITLTSANELYNKERRYYSKSLSFQARVLL
jgi:hypothetical protein